MGFKPQRRKGGQSPQSEQQSELYAQLLASREGLFSQASRLVFSI